MATPKLALIPTGYKAGKLYSVLPESGVGDFTVVRATEATRVNEEGLIETMGANVPRLDYSGGGCPVLLTESQRTNIITYSEDFSNAAWTKTNLTVNTNQTISPNGELTADLLTTTSASGSYVLDVAFVTSSQKYNYSSFVKKSNVNFFGFIIVDGANVVRQYYDINNGVVGSTVNTGTPIVENIKIENYGNGWYRCSLTIQALNSAVEFRSYVVENDGTPTASIGSKIFLWGAQVEAGSYPSSYIKTEGSAVTRNGDQVFGAGDADTFNDSEGVLMMEIATLANDGQYRVISINDGTVSNRVQINITPISNQLQAFIVSGSTVFDAVYSLQDETEFNKIAVSYKLNNFSLWVNGVEVSTDTSGNTPIGLNTLEFNITNAADFYGKTSQVQYFNTVLTDSELETLTSWTSFIEMAQAQQYNII